MEQYNPELLFDLKKDKIRLTEANPYNNKRYNLIDCRTTLKSTEGTPFLSFEALEKIPFIKHGFSTRLGGVSSGDFTTLNLSFNRGDDKECVKENYDRILASMGMGDGACIFSNQVHDTIIHKVTTEDIPNERYERTLEGIDGLITEEKNVVLITSYADCVPLYFVDPVHKAIGLSHSGWKGTVGRIGAKTVKAMSETYGSRPEDIIAVVGPSICPSCYEISEDVALKFSEEFGTGISDQILYNKGNGKYQLDLWLTNRFILEKAGLQPEHIFNSNVCTCCNNKLLFSHRASGGKRGNLAAFLCITE